MGLVVDRRRFASWLALAALALQMLLSFGHVHLEGVGRAHWGSAANTTQAAQPSPAEPGDDDYCAICATIYLAANSFVPQAPILPVPAVSRSTTHNDRVAIIVIAPRRTPFQSRAPPRA
jgi:hypothetical protein